MIERLGHGKPLHFLLQRIAGAGANRLDRGDQNLAGLLGEQVGLEITPNAERYRGSTR